jgi:phosphoketolase
VAGRFSGPLYPGVPGTIHQGGELGYALATVSAQPRTSCVMKSPSVRLRVVNVTDLLILEKESEQPHGLDAALFTLRIAMRSSFIWAKKFGE